MQSKRHFNSSGSKSSWLNTQNSLGREARAEKNGYRHIANGRDEPVPFFSAGCASAVRGCDLSQDGASRDAPYERVS